MSDECRRKFGVEEIGSYRDFEKIICKDCGTPYSIHRGLGCPTEEEIAERSPVERGVRLRAEIDRLIMDIDWQASRHRRASNLKRYLLTDLEMIENVVKKLRELMKQAT